MKDNIIMLPMRAVGLRKPEPITRPAATPALPPRRENPLAVWKRNWVPEQDRLWVETMRVMEKRRASR